MRSASGDIEVGIDFVPRKWQQRCMELQKRFTVLALHRRAGKTTLAVAMLLTAAFRQQGNYVYLSPQKNQSKTNMWDLIKQMLGEMLNLKIDKDTRVVEVRESDLSVRFYNGSKIWLLGAEDPDKVRGAKIKGAIVDEVAQMPREIWSEVLRPALMDTNGWALFIGTPKGINLFSELFERGLSKEYQDEWISQRYTCYETGALNEKEIENYRKEVDENTFRREMLCDFDASAEDQLLSLSEVKEAMARDFVPELYDPNFPLLMGVDVARYGDDRSVIFFRKGRIAERPLYITNVSLVDLASFVAQAFNERKPAAVFVDGTGLGGGVVDVLRQWGLPVYDINFTSRSLNPHYKNRRTEMHFKLADWVKTGGLLPNDEELKKELCASRYTSDEGGKYCLESKKDIKRRLGFSPDLCDALALTFAQDIGIKNDSWGGRTRHVRGSRYTPVDRYERRIAQRDRSWRYG